MKAPPVQDVYGVYGVAAAITFYQQKHLYHHISGWCSEGGLIPLRDSCMDYTQMVWANTEKVGIGIHQNCNSGSMLCDTYVVFKYSPKGKATFSLRSVLEIGTQFYISGNVPGEYVANVSPSNDVDENDPTCEAGSLRN